MSKPTRDEIRSLVRLKLAAQGESAENSDQIENWAVQSIEKNIESGRFERFTGSRAKMHPLALDNYGAIVVNYALAEHRRVLALERNDDEEWRHLGDFLRYRAARMLQRINGNANFDAYASEFAQDACVIIFNHRYPCDIAFEAWVTRILKNLILARRTRSTDAMDRQYPVDSLDAPILDDGNTSALGELISDPQSSEPFEKTENQLLLRNAIDKLRSRAQQQVIILSYFDELSDAQIAQRLGKTTQAIYNLRQRALPRLEEILTPMGVKEPAAKKHQSK